MELEVDKEMLRYTQKLTKPSGLQMESEWMKEVKKEETVIIRIYRE